MADAIQAANFSPDFSAMTPWGNEKIQRCVHDTNGLVVKKKSQIKSKVEFEGSAHKLIAAPDDFFPDFQLQCLEIFLKIQWRFETQL